MGSWIVLAAAACVTCAGPPQQLGTQPSWRHAGAAKAVGPVTFAPASDAASRYNEPLQAPPHTPLGDAVIAAVTAAANQAHVAVPAADARLFRAWAEPAQVVPEGGV